MSSSPSTVVSLAPSALAVKNGLPPTERKALTGEFTPPGMHRMARAKSSEDADVMIVERVVKRGY